MTRTGPSRRTGEQFWKGRLDNARAYRKLARDCADLAEERSNANPIISHVGTAAIAYADALTAKHRGRVNQRDHNAVVKALRDALGNRLPASQERRIRRILEHKDAAQYGASVGRLAEARKLLDDLERFASWAEMEARR